MKAKLWKTTWIAVALTVSVAVTALALFNENERRPEISDGHGAPGTVADDGLVVHEWGTFTSVLGSDGSMLSGLEVEEEALPYFVYDLDRMMPTASLKVEGETLPITIMSKGFRRPLRNVTVKMETPVLYFYSATARDIRVKVGFEGGSISQWYPQRIAGEPPAKTVVEDGKGVVKPVDFGTTEPYQGSIEWKARIEAPGGDDDFLAMKHGETPSWLHPRAPRSNLLTTENGEAEKYLFYRGVGNFELPISVRFEENGELVMSSSEDIPFLLLVNKSGSQMQVLWRGPLTPGNSPALDLTTPLADRGAGSTMEMREPIYNGLKGALVDAGLSSEEASSMLRTWWHSYLHRDGLRAFWVVPRDFTDRILPLSIEPAPSKLERVLLGRTEILTPEFERKLVAEFTQENAAEKNSFRYDRYYKAYAERVEKLQAALKKQ